MASSTVATNMYWERYFEGLDPCHFPKYDSGSADNDGYLSIPVEWPVGHELRTLISNSRNALISTLQSAWALVLNSYTGLNDVNFLWQEFRLESTAVSTTVARIVRLQLEQENSLEALVKGAAAAFAEANANGAPPSNLSQTIHHYNNTSIQYCTRSATNLLDQSIQTPLGDRVVCVLS